MSCCPHASVSNTTLRVMFDARVLIRHFLSPVLLFFFFRHFNLRLKRETALFSPDLLIEVSGDEVPVDTSHIYSGELFGKSRRNMLP